VVIALTAILAAMLLPAERSANRHDQILKYFAGFSKRPITSMMQVVVWLEIRLQETISGACNFDPREAGYDFPTR
jgi:hypothetical protein